MPSAKDLHVAPISSKDARKLVKRIHYSGTVVNNSQLHFGVFWNGRLEGAMQFGPSMDKRKIQIMVAGTKWNGFIELNRMAFSDTLPRNSESRALGIAMRMIRKHYPHIEWVVSFADGAQCGDGTIYRASGFSLVCIGKNSTIYAAPNGDTYASVSLTDAGTLGRQAQAMKTVAAITMSKGGNNLVDGSASMKKYIAAGFKKIPGFMLKYVYFLNKEAINRLTVPILPFSAIDEAGAGMYKGVSRPKQAMAAPTAQRQCNADQDAPNK